MSIARKLIVPALAAVALAMPAAALAAVTNQAGASSRVTTHTIVNSNGKAIYVNPNDSVQLVTRGDASVLQIVGTISSGGHTYYEYQDVATGLCIQANTADTQMSAGGCTTSHRQYWFWNSHVLENLAFGTKAYASGSNVDLGTGSGSAYDWTVTAS
jgi:hypothetical protein